MKKIIIEFVVLVLADLVAHKINAFLDSRGKRFKKN